MRLAIIGSRTFYDFDFLKKTINQLNYNILQIVSGGAKGTDTLAEKYAKLNNIPIKIFLPNWKKYGRVAGVMRNTDIINYSDMVIAFWDGKSKGTLDSINKCKKKNMIFMIINIKEKK